MKATWEVEDGYVCGARKQHSEIDINGIASDFCGANRDEILNVVAEQIQEEFQQNISWFCENLDEIVDAIMARQTELQAECED